jgi:hypothetical protein
MNKITRRCLKLVSYLGLALSIVPALLAFQGTLSTDVYFNLMLVGMVLWFGTAIWWIKPDHESNVD